MIIGSKQMREDGTFDTRCNEDVDFCGGLPIHEGEDFTCTYCGDAWKDGLTQNERYERDNNVKHCDHCLSYQPPFNGDRCALCVAETPAPFNLLAPTDDEMAVLETNMGGAEATKRGALEAAFISTEHAARYFRPESLTLRADVDPAAYSSAIRNADDTAREEGFIRLTPPWFKCLDWSYEMMRVENETARERAEFYAAQDAEQREADHAEALEIEASMPRLSLADIPCDYPSAGCRRPAIFKACSTKTPGVVYTCTEHSRVWLSLVDIRPLVEAEAEAEAPHMEIGPRTHVENYRVTPSVEIGPRYDVESYRLRGCDHVRSHSRKINGKTYDFSRTTWADGSKTVRAWEGGTTNVLHRWHG
jgi:hypothetical protein